MKVVKIVTRLLRLGTLVAALVCIGCVIAGVRPAAPPWLPPMFASTPTAADPLAPMHTVNGQVTRWDRCTVDLVVNHDAAPAGAVALLRAAAADVSAASGMRISVTGSSRARPSAGYGLDGDAPVLVSFDRHGSSGLDTVGSAGQFQPRVKTTADGRTVYSSGMLTIDVDAYRALSPGRGSSGSQYTLFVHELSHLVGLGHSSMSGSVMDPHLGSAAGITDDVRAGYARVVPSACASVR